MLAKKLARPRYVFSSLSIDPALSVTHPSLSTPPPSGTSQSRGRKKPLQRPITPLIGYQIQFGIVVNEAKCSLLVVYVFVCAGVCVYICNCMRLNSVCSPCHPPSVKLKHLIANHLLICFPFFYLYKHANTHIHTLSWTLGDTRAGYTCTYRKRFAFIYITSKILEAEENMYLLFWGIELWMRNIFSILSFLKTHPLINRRSLH